VFLDKKSVEKKPGIRILFFNFCETFLIKCTCTRTYDNVNLFLRETQNGENRKAENPIIFTCMDESFFCYFTFTNNKRVLFSASAKG
jgi:hypothetical protein